MTSAEQSVVLAALAWDDCGRTPCPGIQTHERDLHIAVDFLRAEPLDGSECPAERRIAAALAIVNDPGAAIGTWTHAALLSALAGEV